MANQLEKDGVSKELAKKFVETVKNKKSSMKLNSIEVKKK